MSYYKILVCDKCGKEGTRVKLKEKINHWIRLQQMQWIVWSLCEHWCKECAETWAKENQGNITRQL